MLARNYSLRFREDEINNLCRKLNVTPDGLGRAIKKVLIRASNDGFTEEPSQNTDNGGSIFDGIKSKFRKKSSYNDDNDTEEFEELKKEKYVENKPKMFSESEVEQIKNDAIEDLQNAVLNHTAENCKDQNNCQLCQRFLINNDDDEDEGTSFSKAIM